MIEKKIALVTGGDRGIGRAICVRLAQDGFHVVFSYRTGAEGAAETVQLCGGNALAVQADVSVSDDCARLIETAAKVTGRIDALVNNAGITRDNLLLRMSESDFDAVIAVNLKGCFSMLKGVSRLMLRQRAGRIVNISSVVGVSGNAGQVNYAASKAGVIGMTKSLAKELASRGVTVNAVAPGMIETDMTAALSESVRASVLQNIPCGRMGQSEDVADAVAFLCSEQSRYITGQVLCVDGGMAV